MQQFVDKVYALIMADKKAGERPRRHKIIIVGILFAFIVTFVILTFSFMQKNITL